VGTVGVIVGVVLAILGLFVLVCIPHNLRVRRVRRIYKSLPTGVPDQVLGLIEQVASNRPSVTYLRLTDEVECTKEVLVQSHVGGHPYAESGDEWPMETPDGEPAKFMLQVRLAGSGLGEPWHNRLMVAFLIYDEEQAVKSYADPSLDKYVPLEAKEPPRTCIVLQPLQIPVEDDDGDILPTLPDRLCNDFPEITVPLEPYTKDFAGVVSQILQPHGYGYSLDAPDIAYIGGDPMLIQNPHDPVCDVCGKPMRFLFLFGEIVPGVQMADAGVFYVYGCDDHPDRCKGYVDSH
jgi:hypothetical protein